MVLTRFVSYKNMFKIHPLGEKRKFKHTLSNSLKYYGIV